MNLQQVIDMIKNNSELVEKTNEDLVTNSQNRGGQFSLRLRGKFVIEDRDKIIKIGNAYDFLKEDLLREILKQAKIEEFVTPNTKEWSDQQIAIYSQPKLSPFSFEKIEPLSKFSKWTAQDGYLSAAINEDNILLTKAFFFLMGKDLFKRFLEINKTFRIIDVNTSNCGFNGNRLQCYDYNPRGDSVEFFANYIKMKERGLQWTV